MTLGISLWQIVVLLFGGAPDVPDVESEEERLAAEREKKREKRKAKRTAEGQARVRRSQGARTVLTKGIVLGEEATLGG